MPHAAGWQVAAWASAVVLVVGLVLAAAMSDGVPLGVDVDILRWAEDLRTPTLIDVAKVFDL
ncbi:MAG: hypothetical protein ACXWW5_08470, partial [Actinomycetota bacterium]